MSTSNSWLQQQAQNQPKSPALFWEDQCWTFAEVCQIAQNYAAYYQRKLDHLPKRIVILSENSEKMYFSILAFWELGIEIQFLHPRLSPAEMQLQLKNAGTQVVATSVKDILPVSAATIVPFPEKSDVETANSWAMQGYKFSKIASIMYTSGTTGVAKGVPQTFQNHYASAKATQKNMTITANDQWICGVPLYHISGLSILLRSLVLGVSVRLLPRNSPQEIHRLVSEGKGTLVSVVTKVLKEWLPLVPSSGYPPSFRYILLGGGPIDEETLKRCSDKHLAVIQSYGMTETCSQVVALPPAKAAEKIGSAGVPLTGVALKIASPDREGIGEILLKGPALVSCYLNHEADASWQDGWFHTGDMGRLDEDGYLYVVSRLSELIISGGENIYPAEVEHCLLRHPQVEEAVVVGENDETWGQVPVAFLKVQQALTKESLLPVLQNLAKYKRPKHLFIVREIPKTASNKPLKRVFLTEKRENYIVKKL